MQLNPSEISELIKSKIQNLDVGAEKILRREIDVRAHADMLSAIKQDL